MDVGFIAMVYHQYLTTSYQPLMFLMQWWAVQQSVGNRTQSVGDSTASVGDSTPSVSDSTPSVSDSTPSVDGSTVCG